LTQHLPVLVFNPNKEFDRSDSAITSIYYDNPETWDLYEGRLKKTEGAEAIRLRWYGGMDTETIFVERKTHREDWTGEKSVKARFAMKEKNVNAYMRGDLLPEAIFEKARKEGKKSEKAIAEDERLAKEIQYSVLKKGYVPVCRSYYGRTAFQLPGDARVRISLDTELTMVREDNLDGKQRSGKNWRRMDIGIDWPFSQLPAEDVERFPYAVLEVKLQTAAGQEPPEWVRSLIASHLVEATPKFSKFIHGTATLFPTRINLLPFWMPQMDVDIRKPVTHHFGIQRPGQSVNSSTSDDDIDSDDEDEDEEENGDATYGEASQDSTVTGDPTDEGVRELQAARSQLEDRDLEDRAAGNSLDIEEQIASQPLYDEPDPLYDSDEEDAETDAYEEARRVGGLTYAKALVKHHVIAVERLGLTALHKFANLRNPNQIPQGALNPLGSGEIQSKRFKAPKGKKIHVPVRVEPKVYFAAERTFLSWVGSILPQLFFDSKLTKSTQLEFSIYIGTIAVTLLNFGDKPTRVSFIAAGAFTVVSILSLLYSAGNYLYRAKAIRARRAIKYHDKYGPTALCVTLFIAIALNFTFEGRQRGIF
jgi:uncharacterized membrane protein YidH (DUF202 family)